MYVNNFRRLVSVPAIVPNGQEHRGSLAAFLSREDAFAKKVDEIFTSLELKVASFASGVKSVQ